MAEDTPTGSIWQRRVGKLCSIQSRLCGEEYQPIPDTVDGDGGLEGLTTNCDGYQCYSDQGTLNVPERTRKQKKKIYEDLKKLETRRAFWEPFFGARKLKRWFLVCPDVPDKAVLVYAQSQAKKLRDKNLPYIDLHLEVLVVTEDHFDMANEWLHRNGSIVLAVPIEDCNPADLARLVSDRPTFISNIDRKLREVHPNADDSRIVTRRNTFLESYLKSENALNKLNVDNPEVREAVDAFVASRESTVHFESALDDSTPNTRLMAVRRTLSADLSHDFRNVSRGVLDIVSLGTVVAWLGECPLYFKAEEEGGSK